jgi:GH15 family glucan-1,4-alpha-glucosidase
VGNGAWLQRQIDVYGELPGAAERFSRQLGAVDAVIQRFLTAAADAAASRWRQKDHGIWEIRGEPRDYLYSKLMCRCALVRAVTLAGRLGAEDRVTGWTAARDEIDAIAQRLTGKRGLVTSACWPRRSTTAAGR